MALSSSVLITCNYSHHTCNILFWLEKYLQLLKETFSPLVLVGPGETRRSSAIMQAVMYDSGHAGIHVHDDWDGLTRRPADAVGRGGSVPICQTTPQHDSSLQIEGLIAKHYDAIRNIELIYPGTLWITGSTTPEKQISLEPDSSSCLFGVYFKRAEWGARAGHYLKLRSCLFERITGT